MTQAEDDTLHHANGHASGVNGVAAGASGSLLELQLDVEAQPARDARP